MDNGSTSREISAYYYYSPTCTDYQGVEIWVEIFLRISGYNLKVLYPVKHLVEKSVLATG